MEISMGLLGVRKTANGLLRNVLSSRYEHSNQHTVRGADERITRYHARSIVASDEVVISKSAEAAHQSEHNPSLPHGARKESVEQVLE